MSKKKPSKRKSGEAVRSTDWSAVLRDRTQTMNCRKCGGDIFIAAVDRGTNNTNGILHHIGCDKCPRRWRLAPTVVEALKLWIEFQAKEGLPESFIQWPGGGCTPRFETANDKISDERH